MDEPEDIPEIPAPPEPPPLEALQADVEAFAQEDAGLESPGPDIDLPEAPVPAEQPEVANPPEDPAPEIKVPEFEEAIRPLADQFPDLDLPATPQPKKPNAWQKRHGAVDPPPLQPLPDPPPGADQPRQQPQEPVNHEEILEAAKKMNAIDDHGNINFDAMRKNEHGDPGEVKPEEDPVVAGLQKMGDKTADTLNAIARVLADLSDRLAQVETIVVRIENGNLRRRR